MDLDWIERQSGWWLMLNTKTVTQQDNVKQKTRKPKGYYYYY